MKASEMWNKYISDKTDKANEGEQPKPYGNSSFGADYDNVPYDAWAFGDDADVLAQLVMSGKKTATSSAYPIYELEGEEIPKTGEYSVILNSKNEAVCIIRTTEVYVIPFNQVSEKHAYLEGEGDRSLDYWINVHRNFFTEELKGTGLEFTEEMMVVCEEFEVVYR